MPEKTALLIEEIASDDTNKKICGSDGAAACSSRDLLIKQIIRRNPNNPTPRKSIHVLQLVTPIIRASSYCICGSRHNHSSKALVWLFTATTVLLCVVFPLVSFFADVSFFVICSDHYNETKNLLLSVQGKTDLLFATSANQTINLKPEFAEAKHQQANLFPPAPLLDFAASSNQSPTIIGYKEEFHRSLCNSQEQLASHTPNKISNNRLMEVISAHCYTDTKIPVCSSVSNLIAYMKTDKACRQLEEHKRVTSDVFEPVFIIGSFPCLVFSIFTRLVIMVTNHDHFLSAYVTNIASMPLQLITGALAVHSASYHVGQYGFECWRCAINGNCSDIKALSFMQDHVTVSLIVAIIAKFLDGIAGGCVLFVVLNRTIWNKEDSISWRWYLCRLPLLFISFTLCITLSSTMVLTPSLGVFRLEMMEKTAQFSGRNGICYGSMVILAMGLTAWGISFFSLSIYSCYKTYNYCRVKEHLVNEQQV